MEKISITIEILASTEEAFQKFVNELNKWWPKKYTWSQDNLVEIKIDPKIDGLCTEIGPYHFRCDWGRVTYIERNKKLGLKWQISPKRAPIPDPDQSSDLNIEFNSTENAYTILKVEHFNFENHGEGASEYQEMMGSDMGWKYIINCFKEYCEKE